MVSMETEYWKRVRNVRRKRQQDLTYTRVIGPESKCEIALAVEEGDVTTRWVVVIELDAAVAHGFVVRCVAAGCEYGEIVTVQMDLTRLTPVSK